MRWMLMSMLVMGCGDEKSAGETAVGTDTAAPGASEPDPVISTFGSGRYRASTFAIMNVEDASGNPLGTDLNDDGEVDNKLPAVLDIVNTLIDGDYSVEGLNGSIADAIAEEDLIMFLEAAHSGGELTTDLLLGAADGAGGYGIDPTSYTASGEPQARLTGGFTSQEKYETADDEVQIPVVFDPEQPPVLLPLAIAQMSGTVDAAGSAGVLVGALPVDGLVDQVVSPLLPHDDEYLPEDYLNMERDELLAYVRDLGNNNLADIELDDGRMGVSAALMYVATMSSWDD